MFDHYAISGEMSLVDNHQESIGDWNEPDGSGGPLEYEVIYLFYLSGSEDPDPYRNDKDPDPHPNDKDPKHWEN